MRIRVLDIHADGCPQGGDECEHWDRDLHPGETHRFTMDGELRVNGREVYADQCEFLSVHRDHDDNVKIIVNAFDYQASALGFIGAREQAELASSATVTAMSSPRRSAISTLLWLTGCFALVGVQVWASLTGNLIVFAIAVAALLIAVATRT